MIELQCSCVCQATSVTLALSQPLADYQPRRCDCDFCTERSIVYLSDANGQIQITAQAPLVHLTQGSEQAHFLRCNSCDTVVAVCYSEGDHRIGAVNISLFNETQLMKTAVQASPKLLSAAEKKLRWKQLWSPLQVVVRPY